MSEEKKKSHLAGAYYGEDALVRDTANQKKPHLAGAYYGEDALVRDTANQKKPHLAGAYYAENALVRDAANQKKSHWEGRHYAFFQNTECEYFPCHAGVDPERFNCLFCYCPLYMLGADCGGNFRYTEKGFKDCTGCVLPHLPENYGRITGKYSEIAARMRKARSLSGQGIGKAALPPDQGLGKAALPPAQGLMKTQSSPGRGLGKTFGRIVMLACTARGFETMGRAAEALARLLPDAEILKAGHSARVAGYESGPKLSQIVAQWSDKAEVFIFFTATGIAVRCMAPFVKDKLRDPAVLVVDENGHVVISLLSGHVGGGNRLTRMLAAALGAEPVITTATDGRGLFAVDVFAAECGLTMSDRTMAKEISARLLAGERLTIYLAEEVGGLELSPFNNEEKVSEGDARIEKTDADCLEAALGQYGEGVRVTGQRSRADIIISWRKGPEDREDALYLIPPRVTLGIGCRKGTPTAAIRSAVETVLQDTGVFRQALAGIGTIELKKDEPGLSAFAAEWALPLMFYTAEALNEVPGTFTASEFVQTVTGVDCVCERSALHLALEKAGLQVMAVRRTALPVAAGQGEAMLIKRKQSVGGVTVALAQWRPRGCVL